MSKKQGREIRNKKIAIALMEYIITLGCLLIAFVMVNGNRLKQENSYAKPEEVSRYEQIDGYVARVRPGTTYKTFKEIAENSLKREISVYKNADEMEEVRDGIITSGMVVETEGIGGVYIATEGEKYEISVVGDLTGNGDCNVTELTKIIRSIIGLEELENRGEELSADFNGDNIINVVDITMCIKYIVYGEMEADEKIVEAPDIEIRGEGNEDKGWYRGDVEVEIIEKGEGIAKTQTTVEGNRTQSTTEKEFKLSKEGTYKIKAQSYGTNGTRSEITTRVIGIDKTNPEIISLTRENIDYTSCKIVIRARDNKGIGKYRIEKDGIEARTKEIKAEGEIEEEVIIKENGRYKVIVEDLAGNEVEEEIEIRDLNNRHTVRFKNADGSIISERVYEEGDKIEIPGITPSKEADNTYTYRFIGWTPEVTEGTEVVKDIDYTAEYEGIYKEYTVTFRDEDGEIITSKTDYHYGDTVEVPESPTKAEDNIYTYEFKRWTPELSTEVEENVEYRAEYEAKYKEYEIKFLNEDGSEITSRKYHYGDRIEILPAPGKEQTNEYSYEFKNWKTEEGKILTEETVVTKEESYKVEYEAKYREYEVIFKDEDGTVITSKTNYHYGDTITIPNNPSKAEDNTYTYEFKGWSPSISETEENKVTKDVEYTATYESKYKEYTVTFKQDDGEILSMKTYHYGDKAEMPEEPTKAPSMEHVYNFVGWTPEIGETEEVIVRSNLEYTARYEEEKINYNLKFYNYNDELLETRTYNYGDTIKFPNAEREETEEIKYTLDSWDNLGTEEESSTEINISFKAKYKEEYFVARVEEDEKSYFSLREAIFNAGKEEKTIRLLRDTEESAIVEDKQNITLNLNGHTVTGTKEYTIKTYGSLTVEDNTEAKEGKIIGESRETEGYGIYNKEGKVRVRSGIILAETAEENGRTYAIYNQSTKPVIIEGGSILANAKGEGAISSGIYNLAGEEVKVEGGLILGNAIGEGSTTYGIYNEDEGKIEVTEGIIEGKASLASAISYGIYNKTSEEVVINGGKIVGQSDKNKAYGIYNEEGKVEIEAGEIEITANIGYGVYNEEGEIDNTAGKISMISSTSYGVYNNEGRVNYNGGEIELLGTTTYGIYNNKELSVRGGEISNKTGGSNTYGIYNGSEEEIEIANIKIEEAERGIWNNKGKIEITGVEVRTTEGIYTGGTSEEVVINSGEIITTRNGINNNTGKVIIKDATINSEGYGVFNTGYGITEIGEKGNGLTIEKPQVKGTTYGIYQELNGQGEIRFYDGKIEGRNAIYGGIGEIEENTRIVITEDEEEIATLEVITTNNVAKIGENYYQTLEGAIEAVGENEENATTIEILRNAQLSETTEVPSNKKVKIDLKGYTIETYAQGGIINKGTLEITDTVGAGVGKIESNIGIAISNEGKLTLERGTIKSNNYSVYNYSNGKVIVNDGTINGNIYGIYNSSNNNEIEIVGGLITSNKYGISNNSGNNMAQTIKVTGGIVEGKETGIRSYSGTINLEGGEVRLKEGSYTGNAIYASNGQLNIKAGRIIQNSTSNYAVYGLSTTLNITGGEIVGGVESQETNLTIGTKDGTINTNSPTILGYNYGVKFVTEGNKSFNYYDGKIGGITDSYTGNINDIEEDKEIQTREEIINENVYKTIILVDEIEYENGIAKIGETTYNKVSQLRNAINNLPETENQTEITILNNFETSRMIEIPSNKNILLDLNGKQITMSASIINRGKLEITDKTQTHEGKIKNIKEIAIANISGNKELKITKGNIESKKTAISVNSGKLVIGTQDENIENDIITIKSEATAVEKNSNYIVEMYDGKLIGINNGQGVVNKTEEGYVAKSTVVDGYYETTIQLETPVARIGNTEYYRLQEAIDSAENGQTIELLKTIDNQRTILEVPQEKEITINLRGYSLNSSQEKTIVNNGLLNVINGTIKNTKNNGITIENNGTLNVNSGTILNEMSTGTAISNIGTLNVNGGTVKGYNIGIDNKENATLVVNSGNIGAFGKAIQNDSVNEINIIGGTIGSYSNYNSSYTFYGIYNNVDSNINLTGTAKIINNNSNEYSYGIYNNGKGNIVIDTEEGITTSNSKYGYGIYNKGEGKVTLEKGTIKSENNEYLAYGIKNTGSGIVEIVDGKIETQTPKGLAYGIENGVSGRLEISGGNVIAKTTEGISYGINNISIPVLKITGGKIEAKGTESYGIYNNSSDLALGEKDEIVNLESPIVESDNIGIYVRSLDSKFNFYDGKVIGKTAMNVEATVEDGYKTKKYMLENNTKEMIVLIEKDSYIYTFYAEDGITIISQGLFKPTDAIINEPQIPERYGYIGHWTEYEIGEHDIETTLIYTINATNGTKLQATDKNGITWNFTYQNGEAINVYYESGQLGETVEIPDMLEGCPVTKIYNSTISNSSSYLRSIFTKSNNGSNNVIKKIILPDTIKTIGKGAFSYCYGLSEIELSNGITNLEANIFYYCNHLNTVNIPTSLNRIGDYMFQSCTALTNIDIPDNITNIGSYAFSNCTNLTEINIPDSVTNIERYAFNSCTNLTINSMPNGVAYIGEYAFNNCTNLSEIEIQNRITSIGNYAFNNCTNLSDIYVNNLMKNISKGTNWNNKAYVHYSDCNHEIKKLIEEGLEIKNITYNIVQGKIPCKQTYKFKIINENEEVITDKIVTVTSKGKFTDSEDILETIMPNEEGIYTIENINRDKKITVGTADGGKYQTTDENNITWMYTYEKGKATEVYYKSGDLETIVNVPSELDGYEVISISNGDKDIFSNGNHNNIEKIILPESLISIGNNAFYNYGQLKNIELSSNLTDIGDNAFYNCYGLTNLDIPNNLISIGSYAFYNCYGLTNLDIPDSTTTIGSYAFSSCRGLTNIEIPKGITKIEEGLFSGCHEATDILISNNITSIGKRAFSGTGITNINLPDSITNIDEYAFSACSNLESIVFPSGVKELKSRVFYNCSKLSDVYMDNKREDVTLGIYWDGDIYSWNYFFLHYSDSMNQITRIIEDGLHFVDIEGNIVDESILCGSTYKFKIEDSEGNVITNKKIEITSRGKFTNSNEEIGELIANNEGIYTIENIIRNKTIKVGFVDNIKYQAIDQNGIKWNYTYKDGKATNVYYESGTLGEIVEIPSTLDGHEVVSINNTSGGYSRNIFTKINNGRDSLIKEIILPETVTTIGGSAFYQMYELKNIKMGNVTSIGSYAFYSCKKLTDIYINSRQEDINFGSSWNMYAYYAFVHYKDCSHLCIVSNDPKENITVDDITHNLVDKKIKDGDTYKFRLKDENDNVIKQKELTLKKEGEFTNSEEIVEHISPDDEGVYTIEKVHRNVIISIGTLFGTKFEETDKNGINWGYTYKDGKAQEVYYISGELDSTIQIPNELGGYQVSEISNSSNTSYSIFKNANISSIKKVLLPETLEIIGNNAFASCSSLTEIDIPNSVTSIGNSAFASCSSLTEIEIPNSVTSIGNSAFASCSSLTEIEIPNSVTNIGNSSFNNCSKLTNVTISNSITNIGYGMFRECTSLNNIEIPNSVISIGNNVFYNCTSLNSIILPDSITDIGEYVFYNCTNLENIELSNGLKNIGRNTFYGCSKLRNINIPNTVNYLGMQLFENCTRLTHIDVPDSVTSLGGSAFSSCTNLVSINISSEIEIIESNTFSNCTNLENIQLKQGLKEIKSNAFYNCTKLINIVIPSTVVNLSGFEGCTNLKSINIPDGVKSIGSFKDCSSLESIEMPNTVTSMGTFENCRNLKSVKLSEGLYSIPYNGFKDCSSLEKIEIHKNTTSIGVTSIYYSNQGTFYNCNSLTDIYVNNLKSDINSTQLGDYNRYIHYSDCKHSVTKIIDTYGLEIQDVEGTVENGKIECRTTYKFKIVNEAGETMKNEIVTITSQGRIKNSEDTVREITPDENGIYTIEDIDRDIKIHQENGRSYQATDTNGITWNYKLRHGEATYVNYASGNIGTTVNIPESLDEYPVVSLYPGGNNSNIFGSNAISTINIPNTVKIIGDKAFSGCNITSIEIPENVNYLGQNIFYGCNKLTTIRINANMKNIGKSVFYQCPNLTTVTLPETLEYIDENMFSECSKLKNISIPSNVKEIGSYAFSRCSSLVNITIPDGIQKIKEGTFSGCSSLQNVILPDSISEIGDYAFSTCTSLANIELPDNLDSIGSAFSGCTGFTNIELPDSVTVIGNSIFSNCSNLTNVHLPSGLQEIPDGFESYSNSGVFSYCTNLKSIEIPVGITHIGNYAFYGCENLTNVTIPNSVTSIGNHTFQSCSKLEEIVIPENVRSIEKSTFNNCVKLKSVNLPEGLLEIKENAFSYCTDLTEIEIPETVTNIENYAFEYCKNISSIILPNTITELKGYVFEGCTNLTNIQLPNELINIGTECFMDCSNLKQIDIPNTVKEIGYGAFIRCNSFTKIYIPNSVTKLEGNLFLNCSNLTDIYVDNLEENLTLTNGWNNNAFAHFQNCKHEIRINLDVDKFNLQELDAIIDDGQIDCGENFKFKILNKQNEVIKDDIVIITTQGKFNNLENETTRILCDEDGIYTIAKIDRNIIINIENIPDGTEITASDENNITWKYTYMNGKATNVYFKEGELGDTVKIPEKLDGYDVVSIKNKSNKNIFTNTGWENDTIKSIIIPNTLTTIGSYAFYNCTALKNIEMPDSILEIGDNAFYGCYNLNNLSMSKNVVSIGNSAFYGCYNLNDFNMSKNVVTIGNYAFYDCDKINYMYIPNTIEKIGERAFYYCYRLTDIYIDKTEEKIVLGNNWKDNAYVHFSNCAHEVKLDSNITDFSIKQLNENICGDIYQFKILDKDNNSMINQVITIKTQGRFTNDEYKETKLLPDENGIYTIEKFDRDKIITNIETLKNGMFLTYTDSNGITWEYLYNNKEAENVHYKEGNLLENIIIPSKLNGNPVKSLYNDNTSIFNRDYYYGGNDYIKNIIIPETVVEIGDRAFYNCTGLTTVRIPSSVRFIGKNAFENCYNLSDIYIDKLERNIELADYWNTYGYVHFKNCKHDITFEKNTNAYETVQEVENEAEEGRVKCKNDYKFKLLDKRNNVVTSERVLVKLTESDVSEDDTENIRRIIYNGSGMFDNSRITIVQIDPDENGVYTIEEVRRNMTVMIGNYQATDENGITWNYSLDDDKIINLYYDNGPLGENVEIPETLDGKTVVSICNTNKSGNIFSNYYNTDTIKTIELPSTLETIGKYAFYKLNNLTSVEIPENVTNIGYASFFGCEKLSGITIPDSVTTIGAWAFNKCNALTSITIPESVTKIGQASFSACGGLTTVEILGDIDTIGTFSFMNCGNLSNVSLLGNIKHIGDSAFQYCSSIRSIDLPEGIVSIEDSSFNGCNNLTSINFPSTLLKIGNNAFEFCYYLKNFSIPNSVETIGDRAFYAIARITTGIQLGENITNIGAEAFSHYDTSYIKDVYVNNSGEGVIVGKNAGYIHFINCKHKVTFDIYTENLRIESQTENLVDDKITCGETYKFKILDENDEVVKNANVTITYGTVTRSKINPDTNGIYTISNIKRNTKIEIERKTYQATDGNGITWEYIAKKGKAVEVRYYSGTLRSEVSIPETLNNYPVKSLGTGSTYRNIFTKSSNYYNENTIIETVSIPNTVEEIGDYTFYNCSKLKNIILPEGINKIGIGSFQCCRELERIEIPEGVTRIEQDTFEGCYKLYNLELPKSIKYIGLGAFANCNSLETIVIWKNIDELGYRIFGEWKRNQTINIEADKKPEGWDNDWDYNCRARIVYGYTD